MNTKTRMLSTATSILCLVASATMGAEVNIRGVVYDAGTNQVLSGVKAELKTAALSSTSDAKGLYKISNSTGIRAERQPTDIGARIRLEGNKLSFTVPEGPVVDVRIVATDLQGRTEILHQGAVAPGSYSVPLSERLRSSGVLVLEARVGALSSTYKVVVQSGRMILQEAGSSSAPVLAFRSAAAPWDTLILSKSGYTTVKIVLTTATDSVPRTNLVANSDVPAIASLNAGVVGYATVGGSTTGGGAATPVTVKTLAELNSAVSGTTPRVVIVDGIITATSAVRISSNKTVIGKDKNAKIIGGIEMSGVNNVIVRNLSIEGMRSGGPADAVAVKGASHHIWLDHLAVWNARDGNMDLTQASNYITVSWCKFWYTDKAFEHRLNSLIGAGGGTQPGDWGKNKVTFHHNWFADNVDQRMPRAMYGEVHVYSNYYTAKGNGYCVGFGSYASVLVENNYFKEVNDPIFFMYDLYAWVVQRGNTFDRTTGSGPNINGKQGKRFETSPDQPFEVKALSTAPYTYVATPSADIPTLVSKYAGPQ